MPWIQGYPYYLLNIQQAPLFLTLTGFTAFTYLPAIIAAYLCLFIDSKSTIYPLTKNLDGGEY
ncbi:hypothetical protein [Paenibacillus pseudetheri]|uniref:Uncharacterized protein n=1 Tax=Paenibacillus pseudetheri TaxID=2897682 RepID=A0ABM9B7E7_9BACL|nr:hypothetical protein [Paenibacillus pseudetheri]CAH1054425.1 hypothetical protein PAECIP111894_00570 [Paenibacillus pseudetheri]